ncbi:MAG: ribosome biogenesis GTP-binding protein YihA/YsxC [Syntrophaceae bacterium]|nr:ribosome biogenesis GTP-binding protein YihA/YsxC [Syntrophaceae bacterium]
MKVLCAAFVLSAMKPVHYPPAELPEIAFVGRSNVGKSSLINTLAGRKGLARTSNTPGRTQEINFFRINDRIGFVDLPGYGYAKVPETLRKQWGPMIETYLRERPTLRLVVLILDCRRDPSEEDLQLLGWLRHYRIACLPVVTKIDKLSRNQLTGRLQVIAAVLGTSPPALPLCFSARNRVGKEALWREIEKVLRDD